MILYNVVPLPRLIILCWSGPELEPGEDALYRMHSYHGQTLIEIIEAYATVFDKTSSQDLVTLRVTERNYNPTGTTVKAQQYTQVPDPGTDLNVTEPPTMYRSCACAPLTFEVRRSWELLYKHAVVLVW